MHELRHVESIVVICNVLNDDNVLARHCHILRNKGKRGQSMEEWRGRHVWVRAGGMVVVVVGGPACYKNKPVESQSKYKWKKDTCNTHRNNSCEG